MATLPTTNARLDGLVYVVTRMAFDGGPLIDHNYVGNQTHAEVSLVWCLDFDNTVDHYFHVLSGAMNTESRIRMTAIHFPTYGLVWTDEALAALANNNRDYCTGRIAHPGGNAVAFDLVLSTDTYQYA